MADIVIPYRVLARKYRPQNFDELVGQEALVRTLKNAITSGRIAHAFMLTGVRGVGKTTSARIIAKALNYRGVDGTSGPTTGPTDDCSICRAIAEDRHPDVMEMDAASRTGIDDIREILDGVRYAPSEARYKIYVIDEVHMLSKNAFNALLKTLEEPPPHVKFIFATTEIRKVPVTILSRCQRFDLQRVSVDVLWEHYTKICGLEGVEVEPEAITMIARAADGSVRDGLSLLDQAMALGGQVVTATLVRDMLGLTERGRAMDLMENAMKGDVAAALDVMDGLHRSGAMPTVIVQDLLDLTHALTKIKAVPQGKGLEHVYGAEDLSRATILADKISMPSLGKAWQILLKGLSEVHEAYNPQAALEMVLIRLMYAADLPDPAELIKRLKDQPAAGVSRSIPVSGGATSPNSVPMYTRMEARSEGGLALAAEQMASPAPLLGQSLKSLEDIISALELQNEIILASQLYHNAHLVKIEAARIEMRLSEECPSKVLQDLSNALRKITGERWMITLVNAGGEPTLAQKAQALRSEELQNAVRHPTVEGVLKIFPEARLVKITKINEN